MASCQAGALIAAGYQTVCIIRYSLSSDEARYIVLSMNLYCELPDVIK